MASPQPLPTQTVSASVLETIASHISGYEAGSTHLYHQLAKTIRALIETGALRGNDALPSERDIARATGLSRITVRSAMEDLSREGLISKRRGAGTYVSPQIDQPLSLLLGFTADMKRRGASSASLVLAKAVGMPDADEVLKLGISPAEQVMRLSRVRTSDGDPLAVEHAVVPLDAIDPGAIGHSLYEALKDAGNAPVRALQRLRAAVADATEADLLRVEVGSPILHIERRSFLANGRPIEVTRSAYRGDRYDFIAELKID